jgi:uncharacterized protein (DUF2126 family)
VTGFRLTHPATPFAPALRVGPQVPIQLGPPGTAQLALRVEMPEVWDAVRIDAAPTTPVRELKQQALAALYPDATTPAAFVMKLSGWRVDDEEWSVADVGARDGSIFLLTFRERRPIRV